MKGEKTDNIIHLKESIFIFSFFFSAASSASLIWIDSLEKKRKVKASNKIHVVFFSLVFPPTLPAAAVDRVSWEFTGNFFFISFGFVRKQFQLFQVPSLLLFKATEKFLFR